MRSRTIKAAKAKSEQIIAMSAAVQLDAASGESKGPRRFMIEAYGGGLLELPNFDLPVVVDLAGATFARSVVANLHHDRKQIVGHVTEHINNSKTIALAGLVSGAGPAATEVLAAHDNGFPWQASIEATRLKLERVPNGKTVRINDQTFTGPIYAARQSTIFGVAFLPHGADQDTSVSIAAAAASHSKENVMDKEFVKWLEAMSLDHNELSEAQTTKLQAKFDAEVAAASKNGKVTKAKVDDVIEAARSEDERREKIADITAQAIADNPGRDGEFITRLDTLAKQAIDAKWSPDKFDTEVLRASRPQLGMFSPTTRGTNQLTNKILEAAICQTGGLTNLDKHFDDQTLQAAHDKFKNGIGLRQIFILGAEANGYRGMGGEVTLEVQRAAFPKQEIRAQGWSTLAIPGVLAATANKFLNTGWMGVDQTWSRISARRSVRNFLTITSYSLTGGFDYEKVGPGGELKHGEVGETSYTNKADTYGKMFAITRQDIINDDLGALTQVPQRLGRGAALKLNNVFWTEFLDNSAFFASGNNNVSTGAGSALGSAAGAGIAAAELKFLNQTDPDGNPLSAMPAILLVPPTLRVTALTYMNAQQLLGGSTAVPGANIWQGRFQTESSPYMENSAYTGYSTAAWYLLANPADVAVIEVCFLNGKDTPTVEQADTDFNTLGVQMRGYHDWGVNLQEPRAGVRSAGS